MTTTYSYPSERFPAPPQPQAHRRGNHGRPRWSRVRAGPGAADPGPPEVGVSAVWLVALTGRTERRLQRLERDRLASCLPARRPVIGLLPHPRHPLGRGSP